MNEPLPYFVIGVYEPRIVPDNLCDVFSKAFMIGNGSKDFYIQWVCGKKDALKPQGYNVSSSPIYSSKAFDVDVCQLGRNGIQQLFGKLKQ